MDGTHSCDDNVFVFYIMEWMALSDTVEVGQPNPSSDTRRKLLKIHINLVVREQRLDAFYVAILTRYVPSDERWRFTSTLSFVSNALTTSKWPF